MNFLVYRSCEKGVAWAVVITQDFLTTSFISDRAPRAACGSNGVVHALLSPEQRAHLMIEK